MATDDGSGPEIVNIAPGPRTFATPVVPGRFNKLLLGASSACLLRENGQLTCWTTFQRLAKKPKEASVGIDESEALGSSVVKGKFIQWGEIILPRGPFRDFTGKLEDGCAVTVDDRLACWGESRNLRAFPSKLGDRKVASVSVHERAACVVTLDGELVCLEGLDGNPKPDRKLVRAEGKFSSVDLVGYDWAVAADGSAVSSRWPSDFTHIDRRAPGCFSAVTSDGFGACGLDRGRVRCFDSDAGPAPTHPLESARAEKIAPGHNYYCVLAGGKATCAGRERSIPGGPISGIRARDVDGELGYLCILDEQGAVRCQGEL
jgi:hypothetical protein